MNDYIKREDAKNAVMDTEPVYAMCKDGIAEVAYQKTVDVIEMIDAIPSADVAPVRHGHWEPYSIEPEVYDIAGVKSWAKKYRCSECRFLHTVIEDFGIYTFCPNCGAKMDGGGTDGTDDR